MPRPRDYPKGLPYPPPLHPGELSAAQLAELRRWAQAHPERRDRVAQMLADAVVDDAVKA